jgi:PLP dependent protein
MMNRGHAVTVAEALREVRASIAAAAKEANRQPDDVTLIAVSKTFAAEAIRPALEAGHRVFGENRVQEAQAKWPQLRAAYPDVELHLIGQLQSNKAREAVQIFDAIHSVDRPSLCAALASEIRKQGRSPQLFVQVNTGEEPQKGGVAAVELQAFLRACGEDHGLVISGLMCIPPEADMPAPHFALLAKLARDVGLDGLSMGMSGDFETAVSLGATHVRVGSRIFGARVDLLLSVQKIVDDVAFEVFRLDPAFGLGPAGNRNTGAVGAARIARFQRVPDFEVAAFSDEPIAARFR